MRVYPCCDGGLSEVNKIISSVLWSFCDAYPGVNYVMCLWRGRCVRIPLRGYGICNGYLCRYTVGLLFGLVMTSEG